MMINSRSPCKPVDPLCNKTAEYLDLQKKLRSNDLSKISASQVNMMVNTALIMGDSVISPINPARML